MTASRAVAEAESTLRAKTGLRLIWRSWTPDPPYQPGRSQGTATRTGRDPRFILRNEERHGPKTRNWKMVGYREDGSRQAVVSEDARGEMGGYQEYGLEVRRVEKRGHRASMQAT